MLCQFFIDEEGDLSINIQIAYLYLWVNLAKSKNTCIEAMAKIRLVNSKGFSTGHNYSYFDWNISQQI